MGCLAVWAGGDDDVLKTEMRDGCWQMEALWPRWGSLDGETQGPSMGRQAVRWSTCRQTQVLAAHTVNGFLLLFTEEEKGLSVCSGF